MMYYRLPEGEPTCDVRHLIPGVINPQCLSDSELEWHGVARCVVLAPTVEWWQQRGARRVDTHTRPHLINWDVLPRQLSDVKALAWQRIKTARDARQRGLMPYRYPSGEVHHNQMSEQTVQDLSASTTAALALISQGVADRVMPWTVVENVTHMLTPAQMVEFGLAATQWYSAIHLQSQALRETLRDAVTVADAVAAAEWPAGAQ